MDGESKNGSNNDKGRKFKLNKANNCVFKGVGEERQKGHKIKDVIRVTVRWKEELLVNIYEVTGVETYNDGSQPMSNTHILINP